MTKRPGATYDNGFISKMINEISATILQFALRIWCLSTFIMAPRFSDLPPSLQSKKIPEYTGHLPPLFIILSARNSSRNFAQKSELKSRCSEVSYSRDSAILFLLILLDSAAISLRFKTCKFYKYVA